MKLAISHLCVVLFFASASLLGQQRATDVGTTSGTLSVSRNGAAIYNVQIEMPPGIRQIAPEIGITFNSQAGNSLAGWGWTISGLSSITRIAPTLYHDKQKRAVNFTNTDRFALDGQRLMATSGSYGGDGTVYRTENYSNVKVISYGTSTYGNSYGPLYFIVYYPDGSRAWYGTSSTNSRLEWSIAKWEDPQGNTISYKYKNDDGVLRVHSILFGTRGSDGFNSINFYYKSRVRPESFYVGNFLFSRNFILERIEVSSSQIPYRKYQIAHGVNSLGYETIEHIQEFNGSGGSFEPIVFDYDSSKDDINLLTNYDSRKIYPGISATNSELLTGDFNGDGRMDLISYFKKDKTKINVFSNLHRESELNLGWEIATGPFEHIISGSILSSNGKMLQGQGITTINETSEGGAPTSKVSFKTFALSPSGVVFQYDKLWNAPKAGAMTGCTGSDYFSLIKKKYVPGDFNGDGLLDVMALSFPYSEQNCTTRPECTKPGHISCCDCTENETVNSKVHFIDLDRKKTTGFVNSSGQLNARLSSKDRLFAADFTGDGKTNLVHIKTGSLYIYSLGKNNVLKQVAHHSDTALNMGMPILIGDFNGDGMMDLTVAMEEGTSKWKFFLFKGSDFEVFHKHIIATYHPNVRTTDALVENHYIAQDFNGDGKTDILRHIVSTSDSGNRNERLLLYANSKIASSQPSFEKKVDKSYSYTVNSAQNMGLPFALEARFSNRNLEYGYISGNTLREYEFLKDNRKDLTLISVRNNGITNTIAYQQLSPYSADYSSISHYSSDIDEMYPFANLNNSSDLLLVTHLQESGSGILRKRDFFYKGAVMHAKGLGFMGFKLLHRSNWYGDNVSTLWTSSRQDPQKRGMIVEEWIANFRSDKPYNYASKKSYEFLSMNTDDGIAINVPEAIFVHDALRDITTTQKYTYDRFYNPTKITYTHPSGSTSDEYGYSNNPAENSQYYHIGRPKFKRSISILEGNSFFIQEEYDYSNNLLISIKRKGKNTGYITENFRYDVYGNIIEKRTTAEAMPTRNTYYVYSKDGRLLVKEKNMHGQTARHEHDANGNITTTVGFMGRKRHFEYDGWNRVKREIDYMGNSIHYSYEKVSGGGMRIFTDYDQGQDTYEFVNVFGWTYRTDIMVLNGRWLKKSFQYDVAGRITRESEPFWGNAAAKQWNANVYDEYGRLIEKRNYTGKIENIDYQGLVTRIDDGNTSTILTKDSSGNLISLQDGGGRITYAYFGNGSLKEVDYGRQKTRFTIDGWGRRTKLVDPSAGSYTYKYNLYGELLKETTPKGEINYEYDEYGKTIKKTVVGDETDFEIKYSYTDYHNLVSEIEGFDRKNGKQYNYFFEYDSHQRPSKLSEDTQEAYYEKQITYDSFDRPMRETYTSRLKSGAALMSTTSVRNSYDNESGILEQIVDDKNTSILWELDAHDERGQATNIKYGNGFERISKFDTYGLPKSITVLGDSENSANYALNLKYSFDAKRGLLNSRQNLAFGWQETFRHDNMDRLESISGSVTRNQNYDTLGRIETNSEIGSYTYDNAYKYRLRELGLNDKGREYFSRQSTQFITYNVFKKPVEINTEGKGRASFEYSPLGNRSNAWYGGSEENKLLRRYHKKYSTIIPVEIVEDKLNGNIKILTYVGGDGYTAPIVNIKTKNDDTSGYHYLHRDYLRSILAITDAMGTVKEQRQFGAWGTVDKFIDSKGTVFDHESLLGRGFTGHEHFFDLGLIHMNGRMYDPYMGRFLSPDNFVQNPFDTQSYNRYGYVMNNPLVFVDPSGEMAEEGGNSWLYWVGASAISSLGSSWETVKSWDWKGFGDAIARPFRETGRWFRKLFGGGSGSSPPPRVFEVPTAFLSVDPLVRSNSGVHAVLISSGNGGVAGALSWFRGFSVGALRGFVAGAESSWDFVRSLTTVQGWVGLGKGFMTMSEMASAYSLNGALQRGQIAEGATNFIARIPDMSPGELGYFSGYASEKIVEGVLVSRVGGVVSNSLGFAGSASISNKGAQTIIGEGMKRVSMEAAKRPGSVILNNLPKFTGNAYQVRSQLISYNRLWLLQQMRSGRPILDIGLDTSRGQSSMFYQMEQNMVKNYLKLHPNAFQLIKP